MYRIVSAGVALALPLSGCALPKPPPVISMGAAAAAVGGALGLKLTQVQGPDTPALANVLATWTSPIGPRSVLVLVFDSSLATEQAVMHDPPGALLGVDSVRVRNVVVLYRGVDEATRRGQIVSALVAATPR